jgi:arylsulfatase A-like enzyme
MKTPLQFVSVFVSLLALPALAVAQKPSIIIIYGDDVGFGDLQCYGGSHVQTPNVDRLAKEGLRFVNGYATSATCTPSRFSILTGEYAFRQKGTGVLPGNAPLIIKPGTVTTPAILQRAGYITAAIGKWHLGLGTAKEELDWNGDIKPGPLEIGFNHCFIIPATPDRVPCVYVQDHRVFNLDPSDPIHVSYRKPIPGEVTYKTVDHSTLKMTSSVGHNNAVINGIGRIGYMTGGKSALWKDDEIEDVLAKQAVDFIEKEKDHPFFLYYASHDIHVPRVPNKRFVGKTGMGPRGDELAEFDWAVGQILDTLDRLKLTDNTLVILSSDNGPVLDDGYNDDANQLLGNHKPAGPLRAGKYSIFDGGTRVPFIVRWPGKVKPGVSSALVSQVDLASSLAALTGQKLGADDAPDSQNVLPALLGQSPTGRASLVEYDQRKERALRAGDWKFILPGQTCDGLGPWTGVKVPAPGFLFDLATDPGEKTNLANAHPGRTAALAAGLSEIDSQFPRHADATPVLTNNVDTHHKWLGDSQPAILRRPTTIRPQSSIGK